MTLVVPTKSLAEPSEYVSLAGATEEQCDDFEFVLEAIQFNGLEFRGASPRLRRDLKLQIVAIRNNPDAFDFIPEEQRGDWRHLLMLIEYCSAVYQRVLSSNSDMYFSLDAVVRNPAIGPYLPDKWRNDSNFLSWYLKRVPDGVPFTDDDVLNDTWFLSQVAPDHPQILNFVEASVRGNRKFMLSLIRLNHKSYPFAVVPKQKQQRFLEEASKANPGVCKYMTPEARQKFDYALIEKIAKSPEMLGQLPTDLRIDRDFLRKVLIRVPDALRYVPEPLRSSVEFLVEICLLNHDVLNYVQITPEFLLKAIECNHLFYPLLDESLKLDTDFNHQAVRANYRVFQYLYPSKKGLLARVAISMNGLMLEYAEDLQQDVVYVTLAMQTEPSAIMFADVQLFNDFCFMMYAVNLDPANLVLASPELKENLALVINALYKDGLMLAEAGPMAQDNPEVVAIAVRQNEFAWEFASPRLKANRDLVLRLLK